MLSLFASPYWRAAGAVLMTTGFLVVLARGLGTA